MFPVRCFTCNKIIGQYEQKYNLLIEQKVTKEDALNSLNIKRYCCRRMFLSYVNIIDKLLLFPDNNDNIYSNKLKNNEI